MSTQQTNRPHFLTLHDMSGAEVRLQTKFIIAAIGQSKDRSYCAITVDDQHQNTEYRVKENLEAITGPFADLKWCKLNPAYVSAITANTDESAATYPHKIIMRAPRSFSYVTSTAPAEIEAALDKAWALQP